MWLEHRLSKPLQLYLHSRLNTWLQWIDQRQLQDETTHIKFLDLVRLILEVWRLVPACHVHYSYLDTANSCQGYLFWKKKHITLCLNIQLLWCIYAHTLVLTIHQLVYCSLQRINMLNVCTLINLSAQLLWPSKFVYEYISKTASPLYRHRFIPWYIIAWAFYRPLTFARLKCKPYRRPCCVQSVIYTHIWYIIGIIIRQKILFQYVALLCAKMVGKYIHNLKMPSIRGNTE